MQGYEASKVDSLKPLAALFTANVATNGSSLHVQPVCAGEPLVSLSLPLDLSLPRTPPPTPPTRGSPLPLAGAVAVAAGNRLSGV